MGKYIFPPASLLCGLVVGVATYSVAESARIYLDEASKVPGGGTPYFVGMMIAGLSLAAVVLFCGFMSVTRWSSVKLVVALQAAVVVCLGAALGSSLWFIFVTGLFNIVGVIGVALAALGAYVGMTVLSRVKKDLRA